MGASLVVITVADNLSKEEIESAQSIIMFDINDDQEFTVLAKIGEEIKKFLESKGYLCFLKNDTIITNAKLLPD
jgi:hypothetical protein